MKTSFIVLRLAVILILAFLPLAASPAQNATAAPAERPLLAVPPLVSLQVPATALIGANVNFTVTFDNPDPVDPGYGPLIDLVIPTNGPDGAPNPDGLTFISATYLGSTIENTAIVVPGSGCIAHPYMMDGGTQAPLQVCGLTSGDTFVALRLPFGSFTSDQPPLTITVNTSMSNLADLGTPLTIQARGGYQYGYNPLNDFCCGDDPVATLSSWVSSSVTPILFTLEKTYSGPEDETATGPNYPRQYTVTAQIAPGQTLSPFTLNDILPDNMQFVSLISPVSGCTLPSTVTPGGTLSCAFASASGTVSMTFSFYIPLRDLGSGSVISPSTGDDVFSCNNASGGGTWTPIDSRDLPASSQTIDEPGCEHTLTDKSIATQKGVAVVGGGQPAPGRILEYTVDVQVSDFFVFDQVVVTDTFSDGQRWDTTFTPSLQILGNPATLDSSGNFNVVNYTVSPNYTPADPAPNDGTTTITFRVSDEMISRSADGRLIGGCVPPAGMPGDPNCGAYDNGATTARIVFRTVIQEDFSDTFPSGDSSVDQGDVLDNTETVNGRLLSTTDATTPTGFTEADGSSASVTIGRGTLSKAVYAVNGVTPPPSPVRVASGDTVTFRLTYTLITSDFESLALTDYLPLPIFSATEVTVHNNAVCGVPAAGISCLGPSDTYHSLPGAVNPAVSNDGVSNWVRWAYGNYDSAVNTASTIDLLFTVTVEDDPFADNMHLTNQAYATEGSTNGAPGEDASIIEITFTAPVMTTTKSAVATNAPAPIFAPALPIAFTPPGSGPLRWGGTINSNLLATTPIDSDVSGLDAGDLVTFAIFLVNEGSGINGAFDIAIRDTFDAAGFEFPTLGDPNSLNLQIYYGNGSGPIPYTGTPGDLFGTGIELVDPPSGDGVCQAHDPVSGNNVIVITYDLRLRNDIVPGTYPNTATLTNYSGSEGGPNFLPEPISDDATVTTDDPLLIKSLVGTELNTPQNSNTQVVIGELLTYTLTLTVPEGILPAAQIVDTLDAGLAFLDLSSVTFSNPDTDGAGAGDDGIYSTVMTFNAGGNCTNCTAGTGAGSNPLISAFGGQDGRRITFDFGDLVNTNRDNNVDETITITYRAVVLNVVGNQSAGLRNNSAALTWTSDSLPVVSAPNVTIIEPVINTAKSVLPTTADAGDTVTFTVTLTNPAAGSTTAYDATWSDTLPAALTYAPGTLALGACTASTPLTLSDAGAPTLTGSGALFQPGESCVITFDATINYSAAPGQVITNTAITQWTSLSGSVSDRSTYNTDSDERTGADGVGGALNDYASQGSAAVTINSVQPQKFLVSTSELFTGTPRVAIGEIVRYRMVVQLPEGTSVNFQIRDNLPGGLMYLDDGTARLALLSNGTPIVSTNPTGDTLGLGLGNGPFATGPWVNGNDPTLVIPTFALPDQNAGSSNSIIADPDTYATGTDPFFKLGTLTNNDSDGDAEYIIVEFNALVDNTAGGSNDAGDNRNNTFSVFISGTQNGPNSNSVQVTIAEPLLSLVKAVTTAPIDAGDSISYTLTITSASGVNRATAFDLNLSDTFDANLTGLTVSGVVPTQGATCTGNGAGVTAFSHNGGVFAGNSLTFTATCLDPGQTITLTLTGTVAATAPVGYVIPNTANLVYTSLPGPNGTTVNPTGSSTPGASGTDNGERNGSDGVGGAVDDYAATSSANTPLAAPLVDKLNPVPSQYVIGDLVTFDILVTLPEGVTPALQVVDDLPLGLEYVSHQVITAAVSSGGILALDFNGTLPAPTVTAPGGSGGDLTLVFGDTTTADDNITTNNAFLVRVVARVLNIAGNQNGTVLTNTANVTWTGGSATDSTTIALLEPVLNILKAADDSTWVYGQTVTFTLSLENLAANGSTVDAHDVVITDAIPAGLTYVPASITATGGCAANDTGAPTLAWTCVSVPLGATLNFSYQVTVNSPPTPPFIAGDATVTNTATTTWTSQPGDNNPGADDGERDGSGGVDDYSDSGSHTGGLEQYYSLGNRVWFDTDNDGTMDAGEQPVAGVLVQLYDAADLATVLASDVTNADGFYLFDYLLPGDYVVAIAADNFDSAGTYNALVGYWSSGTTINGAGVISELTAPNADTDNTDADDNGTLNGQALLPGAVVAQAVTLGPSGLTEPTGEAAAQLDPVVGQGAQPDGRANMTVDFGFYRVEIGNLVYRDNNVDGAYDGGDTLLANVTVELLSGDGLMVLAITTTNASGEYRFNGQPEGDYRVRVTTPSGHVSTIDTSDLADTTDPDGNVDDNDNGIGIGPATTTTVQSGVVTLDAGNVGAQSNNLVTNADGTTYDPTLDFGFTYAYALGNRVWYDTDNNSQIDFADGEVGVNGVSVQLYAADGSGDPTGLVLETDLTANGGYYLFDNLTAGDYVVVLPATNFAASAVLEGYWSSATYRDASAPYAILEAAAPDPDGAPDVDSDDNGQLDLFASLSGAVASRAVTLGPTGLTEPIGESDVNSLAPGADNQGLQPDGRANMTVDFGFYKVSVGDLVWADADRDGEYDSGEPLLQAVTVNLYAPDGTTLLATTTTDANGEYRFDDLPEGTYIISVIAPDGTFSTVDTANPADTTDPNSNADNNDNGIGVGGGEVFSNPVQLIPGSSGAQNNNQITNPDGTTHNPTLDFGFTPVYSLGNRVWYDTNNSRAINFGDELGIDDVRVQLFDTVGNEILVGPDGILGTGDDAAGGMLTGNGGYYLFNGLEAGEYVVVLPASNFAGGAVLEGYWSSGTTRNNDSTLTEIAAPDPDNDVDSDDNGTFQTGGAFPGAVVSLPVTLGPTFNEPPNESDLDVTLPGNQQGQPDAQANMTVDFGFYTMRLGNQVWNDLDNSGLLDGAEVGINGVTVELWSADGSTLLATTPPTAGGGIYTFTDLPQGNYIVRLPEGNFTGTGALRDYYSSTGPANGYEPAPNPDADLTDSDDNGSEVGSLGFAGGYIQSAIFALTPQAEQTFEHNQGLTTEFRVDFGVFNSPQVDLAVTKDDGQDFYLPGGTLTYIIVVSNNGPADVTGAIVSDSIPAQIASWTWVCSGATGGATGCDGVAGSNTDFTDTVNLPVGSTITYTVTATVDAAATGQLTNTVIVAPPVGTVDTNPSNDEAVDIDEPASLTVTKTNAVSVVAVGTQFTYDILVTNNGGVALSDLTVVDSLPAEVTYASAVPVPSNVSGSTITWNHVALGLAGTFNPGDAFTIQVTVDVTSVPTSPGGDIINSVTVSNSIPDVTATATHTDVVADNRMKSLVGTIMAAGVDPVTGVVIPSVPDYTTTPEVVIGEILTYQIAIDVPAGLTLTNLKALDTMDAGLAFVRCVGITSGSLTTTLPGGFTDSCNAPLNPTVGREPLSSSSAYDDGRRIEFTLGDVSATGAETLTITYEVIVLDIPANVDGVGDLNNQVTWSWDGGSLSASADPVEVVEPDMSIEKDANPTVAPYGATITFTLDIAHTIESTADAFDVIVTDILPPGLAFIPGTVVTTGLPPTTIDYDAAGTTLTFIWDVFPLNETALLTFQTTFVGPAPVINTSNVAWTSLPIDPGLGGQPVQISPYNDYSTERWYDPADSSGINNYGVSDSISISIPDLPETGFAPGRVTALQAQSADKQYAAMDSMWLEIPALGLTMPLTGVPLTADGWDLTWLSNQAGYLQGTTYPGDVGTMGITSHVTLADGTPGPFRNLGKLFWGNKIILHADGYRYVYEVRDQRTVLPTDLSVFKKDGYTWMTLLTCEGYVPWLDSYNYRLAVRAVLLSVEPDSSASPFPVRSPSSTPAQRWIDR